MQDWRTIGYRHWQPRVDLAHPAAGLGELVFGHLDVEQAVRAIMRTEKRTVPLEPWKCVELMPWVDKPEPLAIPNLTRELWDGISTYEPRVVLRKVEAKWLAECRWLFRVWLHLAGDVDKRVMLIEAPHAA